MAHIKTKDPFGFVGSHVIRKCSAAAATTRGFSGFGGGSSSSSSAANGGQDEHGWITRYDARLDSYTLFIPGKGPSTYTRGDIMKLISDPGFHVQNDDDDEYPAPIEDTKSRYVDVPMVKSSSTASGVAGTVKCYLPFADLYKVVYDDQTTEEVSEDTIIDSMIRMLASQVQTQATTVNENQQQQRQSKKRKRVDVPAVAASVAATPLHVPLPPATVRSVSAPVPPVSMMPVSFSPLLRMGGSPVVTHSNILELASTSSSSSSVSSNGAAAMETPRAAAPVPAPAAQHLPPPSVQPLSATTPFIKNEPPSSDNIIMLIDDEPAVEMIPLDADDVIMQPVVSSSSTEASAGPALPRPFYLISDEPYEPVKPLEKRSVAYGCLRQELLNILDRREAGAKKIAMQYDILRNPDIKIVAMLPTPTHEQVIESGIGKTIGFLSRSRPPPPFTRLPKSIGHLAKWIRGIWTERIKRDPGHKQKMAAIADARAKSGRPSKHLGTRTPPGSGQQRRMPPIEPIDMDSTPILRRAIRPVLPNPPTSTARPAAAATDLSLPLSNGSAGGRKSNLKPDWMRQKENLTRTRFSIGGDSTAEFNHYKRVRRNAGAPPAPSSAQGSSSYTHVLSLSGGPSGNPASYHGENEQLEGAGGDRGTYGRRQRLTFGSRWSVVEFLRDSPPDAVRSTSHFHSQQQRYGRPRSILRRQSKYRDDLGSI